MKLKWVTMCLIIYKLYFKTLVWSRPRSHSALIEQYNVYLNKSFKAAVNYVRDEYFGLLPSFFGKFHQIDVSEENIFFPIFAWTDIIKAF